MFLLPCKNLTARFASNGRQLHAWPTGVYPRRAETTTGTGRLLRFFSDLGFDVRHLRDACALHAPCWTPLQSNLLAN